MRKNGDGPFIINYQIRGKHLKPLTFFGFMSDQRKLNCTSFCGRPMKNIQIKRLEKRGDWGPKVQRPKGFGDDDWSFVLKHLRRLLNRDVRVYFFEGRMRETHKAYSDLDLCLEADENNLYSLLNFFANRPFAR